jgi:hypothetical protein
MSCIRITTDAMREQIKRGTTSEPVSQFLSPPLTDSKIRRVTEMANSDNPRIRESAALSYQAPVEVFEKLANDKAQSVRECLARNYYLPENIATKLSADSEERVRAFVASNPNTPKQVLHILADDTSELVQKIANIHLTGW